MFLKVNDGYECNCGDNTFTIKKNKRDDTSWRLFGIVTLDMQIEEDIWEYPSCGFYLYIGNNKIHIGSDHEYDENLLARIADNFNEQIQKQVEQMYSIGGKKYWESQVKMKQLQNGDAVNDKHITLYSSRRIFNYYKRGKNDKRSVLYKQDINFWDRVKIGDYILIHRNYYNGFSFENFIIQPSFIVKITHKEEKLSRLLLKRV